VQVSRILGHSNITTTLDVYSHLFDAARHAAEIRERMAASPFVALLNETQPTPEPGRLVALRTSVTT